jgi:hypothetical protein
VRSGIWRERGKGGAQSQDPGYYRSANLERKRAKILHLYSVCSRVTYLMAEYINTT